MNIALRRLRMTREAFFDWAERQNTRHEFDGFQPVTLVGGTNRHNRIGFNIHLALRTRLLGSRYEALGVDAGDASIGDALRYPDALVTCSPVPDTDRLVPGVVAIYEVLSPSSGVTDRHTKLLEYAAVPTIRHCIILEQETIAATLFERPDSESPWAATPLAAGATLRLAALDIEIPIDESYEGVQWLDPNAPAPSTEGEP